MDQLKPLTRRALLAGMASLPVTGCALLEHSPAQEYLVRRGDVLLQFVEAESQKAAFSPGPQLYGIEATSVTTYTYQGILFTNVDLEREVLELRPRRLAGLTYVTVPAAYPNSFQSTAGSTKRYPSDAYASAALLGQERPKLGKPLGHSKSDLTIPINPEEKTVTSARLGPYWLEILEATPVLIRYRIRPQ